MTLQINVRLSPKLEKQVAKYVDEFGYTNVQELIKEALREKIHFTKLDYLKQQAVLAKKEKTYSREDFGL